MTDSSIHCTVTQTHIYIYFQVHKRAAQRQSLMHKLDVQFKEIGYQFGRRFAGEELSFDFLARSNEYLAKVYT